MLEREVAVATSSTGESTEAVRRVKSVPTGTTHWFLCDEIMLVGSRSEELVYSCMIHGGARSAPGATLQLGMGLLLRMEPTEPSNHELYLIRQCDGGRVEVSAVRWGEERCVPLPAGRLCSVGLPSSV
jgi:hypothetical protein